MTDRALYLRIADEIADEIRSGRLTDGQPVPSTRQIVRDWGVAMATATKVINALRTAGLVETKPGSGTVVRPREQCPAGTSRSGVAEPARHAVLTRHEICDAAVQIADAEGLGFVTMRRVAAAVGVSTMALYRHIPNRNDLTVQMADSVFASIRIPPIPVTDWRQRLDSGAHLLWTVFNRHPWAAEVLSVSRPQQMPNLLPIVEWSLSTLRAMGFDAHDMMCTHINLFGHVRAMALVLLAESQAQADTGMSADDWMRHRAGSRQRQPTSTGHPGIDYVTREQFDFNLDTVFEYGLQRILDGIDAHHRTLGLAT
ncbi:GntR family transcriptional regulator [Nocardia sp. NPDC046763]|uniref:GntR family transcriptional regulator n=1 Tax=Nocardia sp. NPDC046763 TaxID=3155256 RepID=UPI0033D4D51F